jgi:hypothetical protein
MERIKTCHFPLFALIRKRLLTVSEENNSSVSFEFGLDMKGIGV